MRRARHRVYTHCMRRIAAAHIAVRFWGIVAFGDGDCPCRTAAIVTHLLPGSRRSFLRDGQPGQFLC